MKKHVWFLIIYGIGAIIYFGGIFLASFLFSESIEISLIIVFITFIALINTLRVSIEDEQDKAP